MSFAEQLYFHRRRLGWTQAEVAKIIKTNLRTYWSWESDVNEPNTITRRVVLALLESLPTPFHPVKIRAPYGTKLRDVVEGALV